MSKILITKTVDLDFLGDKYKGSSIEVRVITMREREAMLAELGQIGKDENKSFEYVKNTILERFVKGTYKDGENEAVDISKDDLLDLPAEVFIEVMAQLQGRTSPKS